MLAQLGNEVYAKIKDLSDDELQELIRSCETATPIIAEWVEVQLASGVEAIARREVQDRKILSA